MNEDKKEKEEKLPQDLKENESNKDTEDDENQRLLKELIEEVAKYAENKYEQEKLLKIFKFEPFNILLHYILTLILFIFFYIITKSINESIMKVMLLVTASFVVETIFNFCFDLKKLMVIFIRGIIISKGFFRFIIYIFSYITCIFVIRLFTTMNINSYFNYIIELIIIYIIRLIIELYIVKLKNILKKRKV
jgi:uncharacterized membrane protein